MAWYGLCIVERTSEFVWGLSRTFRVLTGKVLASLVHTLVWYSNGSDKVLGMHSVHYDKGVFCGRQEGGRGYPLRGFLQTFCRSLVRACIRRSGPGGVHLPDVELNIR